MSEEKSTCTICEHIIHKEIEMFEEFIKTNHPELERRSGIDTRKRMILFANRHMICGDKYSKNGLYLYHNYLRQFKNCFSWFTMRKVIRRIRYTDDNSKYETRYLSGSHGACDRKIKYALKKARDYYPEISNYYLDLDDVKK